MTVNNRIVAIRLSEKLERNPEYASKLGISVRVGKVDIGKKDIQKNGEEYCGKKER